MAMEGDVGRGLALVSPEWAKDREQVSKGISEYNNLFKGGDDGTGSVKERQAKYMDMVNGFYNLVTDFYEFGWGQSFHFAPRHSLESFSESTARHEHWLAKEMGLKPGMKVLDVGAGIGGPARAIARFSSANVICINNNDYQIKRGTKIGEQVGMPATMSDEGPSVSFTQSDFTRMSIADEYADAAFQVEATCHAPDKVAIYKEIFRTLKPGAYFGGYEWVVTPKYDASNPRHQRIKFGIEKGNGLPELVTIEFLLDAMREAGFEIIKDEDRALTKNEKDIPWYEPLAGSFSLTGFKHTRLGRYLTNRMCFVLEKVGVAPAGTVAVSDMLCETALDLVDGGKDGIFTPMHFVLARKPL